MLSVNSWEWNDPVQYVINGFVGYFAQCHLHLLSSASPDFCICHIYTLSKHSYICCAFGTSVFGTAVIYRITLSGVIQRTSIYYRKNPACCEHKHASTLLEFQPRPADNYGLSRNLEFYVGTRDIQWLYRIQQTKMFCSKRYIVVQSRRFSENQTKLKTFSVVEMQFEYMKLLQLRVE